MKKSDIENETILEEAVRLEIVSEGRVDGKGVVETWKVASGRSQLMKDLIRQIGSLDMTDSGNALDALLDGIQKIQREVRQEMIVAEDDVARHFGS
jgi:arginine/ornithine N-succinyltransferase beta subunit